MMMKIFSIRDAAVEAFLQPFFSPTTGAAVRSVSDAVNDPKHQFFQHAKDYSLWHLGDFDDATGAVSPLIPPNCVGNLIEFITKPN